MVESYGQEPEPTLLGVINAFTRAAHELPPLARIDVERFAERVLMDKVEVSSNGHKAGEKPAFSCGFVCITNSASELTKIVFNYGHNSGRGGLLALSHMNYLSLRKRK